MRVFFLPAPLHLEVRVLDLETQLFQLNALLLQLPRQTPRCTSETLPTAPHLHARGSPAQRHSFPVQSGALAGLQARRLAGSQASTCCSLIVSMNCGIAFIIVAASDVVHKWALSQEGLANPRAKPQAQQLKLEVYAWPRESAGGRLVPRDQQ